MPQRTSRVTNWLQQFDIPAEDEAEVNVLFAEAPGKDLRLGVVPVPNITLYLLHFQHLDPARNMYIGSEVGREWGGELRGCES